LTENIPARELDGKIVPPQNSRMKSRLLFALSLFAVVQLRAADTNAPAAPVTNAPAAQATNAAVAPYILTPPAPATPRINGPNIFGVRPGSPFLYTIPATGDRPMTFSADKLPRGLKLDPQTGHITGSLHKKKFLFLFSSSKGSDTYEVTLRAKNALGTAEKKFRIVVGSQIALTPPMGWNSWNCFAGAVSEDRVKSAADAMVKSGLINHGWTYINVDDYWQNHRLPTSADLTGPFRDTNGFIVPNSRFPDMKGMADYIHNLGLKAGLYSSPGPWTCGGCASSWQHELQDAQTYAQWGFDYLKYDWCSYRDVVSIARTNRAYGAFTNTLTAQAHVPLTRTTADAIFPYKIMGKYLREQNRDIVFSLCQYGNSDVWKWGGSVDGSCWRTTGDITDTWRSMSQIGFRQERGAPYAKPGNWNDPDMLVVGQVGWGRLHPSRLTPDEQYTHISLWCLLSAPLLIGCDMTKLDEFTLNLLENDEVLALDQDSLGKQAMCVVTNGDVRIYQKELEDGGRALGFFNLGAAPANLEFNQLATLGFTGAQHVRDVWRQQNLPDVDAATGVLKMTVPVHGVVLYRLTKIK
jgi:alpha-galactosidase